MKNITIPQPFVKEIEMTELPWPKTWNGAYLFVMSSFIFWIMVLVALTECFA